MGRAAGWQSREGGDAGLKVRIRLGDHGREAPIHGRQV